MIPSPAHADAYCVGLLNEALTYNDGGVMIYSQWRNDWTHICNLNTTWNSISPQTCFAWFSQIQTAVTARRPIGVYYAGLAPAQCATMPVYTSTPAPLYVRSQ